MTTGDADRARNAADAAARESGVTVRPLHGAPDAAVAISLFDSVWRPGDGDRPISAELLVALAHSGNYVVGAFSRSDLVGAAAGFLAAPPGEALHSHIAAVAAAARGRHVGLALKLDQRAWALEVGLSTITWTYDPLVRRNAAFNLRRLGARPVEYLQDFYGAMTDSVNAGDASDRVLVAWPLADDAVAAACEGAAPAEPPGARPVLEVAPDGSPRRTDVAVGAGDLLSVATPADVERLRRDAPDLARAWRVAVRDTLGTLVRQGGDVVGLTGGGAYVVRASGGSGT